MSSWPKERMHATNHLLDGLVQPGAHLSDESDSFAQAVSSGATAPDDVRAGAGGRHSNANGRGACSGSRQPRERRSAVIGQGADRRSAGQLNAGVGECASRVFRHGSAIEAGVAACQRVDQGAAPAEAAEEPLPRPTAAGVVARASKMFVV